MSFDKLSECAASYAKCLESPTEAEEGCIPATFIAPPSRKLKVWAAGSAVAPVGGTFFILVRPLAGACHDRTSTDSAYVTITDGAAPITHLTTDVTTLGVSEHGSNSPYAHTDYGEDSISVRHVATEILVWNETNTLNREGSIFAVTEPDHDALTGGNSSDIAAYESSWTAVVGADAKRYSLKWNGIAHSTELDYQSAVTNGPTSKPCMAVISNVVGNQQSWRWRATSHYELIGKNVPGKTNNWVDPSGAGVVNNAAAAAPRAANRNHSGSGEWLKSFKGLVSNGIRHLAPMAGAVAKAALPHLPAAAMSYATGNPALLAASVAGKSLQKQKKKKAAPLQVKARR